jgi:hypothetical protein
LKETEFHPALQELLKSNRLREENYEAQLLEFLREEVRKLLEGDTEKLWQILYRLDVSEMKVREALNKPTPSAWPEEIAKLILKRESERQFWKEKYRRQG